MNKFIYLNIGSLTLYDPSLAQKQWFNLNSVNFIPSHIQSRVHRLPAPYPLADTLYPIPTDYSNNTSFGQSLDSAINKSIKFAKGKTVYICWSGGIDSTAILVSYLQQVTPSLINQTVVLYNESSIQENPYFFYKFLNGIVPVQHIDTFVVTPENYSGLLLIDGEGGNQCTGSTMIHRLVYQRKEAELTQPWLNVNLDRYFHSLNLSASRDLIDMLTESVAYSPVEIKTVFDLLWWFNFNFKFDDAILRKVLHYAKNLNAQETKEFYNNNLIRPYADIELQKWALANVPGRTEFSDLRLHQKLYINQFDKNDLWLYNKREQASTTASYEDSKCLPTFAIDDQFQQYSFSNREHRILLGKIINKELLCRQHS